MTETLPAKPASPELVRLPILPLRDVIIYPYMVIPLFVGRTKSIKALEESLRTSKQVMLIAQKDAVLDDPQEKDLYKVGTVSTILQLLKLPDGTVKVLVEGISRGVVKQFFFNEEVVSAEVEIIKPKKPSGKAEVLVRSLLSAFDQYVKLNKKIPPEVLTSLNAIEDPERLTDSIAAHLMLKIKDKQDLLEIENLQTRIQRLLALIEAEIDLLQVEKRIRGRVRSQMEKSQREYYLNEQMKAIQKELSDLEEGGTEQDILEKKIKESGMPKEAEQKAIAELNKLKMMAPMSAEATVSRNYLDWLISVPWTKASKINKDIHKAEKVLEREHYGLERVKERIIEYLAVQQRVKKMKGPILCLVGPPGVGKTSLGQSIANATGRKFVRVSLGGVRDEAEIRGHRRTYIGALPGKIIQKLAKVETKNPLFMLDEIDKLSMDFRGDPASALLEVLDPEQNNTFSDHYLEVDYDLSDVMFIATANTLDIPHALLDRMEVIRLSGYTEDEKLHIARQHLVPKQIEANGLKSSELKLSTPAILDIIRYYTREAGVRNLEREISKICRKVVRQIISKKNKKQVSVISKNLQDYLGVRRFSYGSADKENQIGQVTGLAWTEVGGELLKIEAALSPGKGKATITGQIGDVMQESIQAALTVVRARYEELNIDPEFFEKNNIHIHVPEGATPKDGPSAGIGMCTVLVSTVKRIPVRADVAMTGEITLRGEVLAIGGLKEKLLAAHRGGIKHVIIPKENEKDLIEIPDNIKKDLIIHPVRWIDEVLELALTKPPKLLKKKVK
ncbi:MAG: endopeptidase La [Gammaproteobacteria bacterium RIFCSPHIGHO2_12_FULL_35_23]|nr:MAG: endopeptidase La [Gammaproteobacteria bacterium RIFCSPHIGHO2_12_FULL_35_23]